MGYDISSLAETPSLNRIDANQAWLVVTARYWVCLRKRGFDPMPTIAQRLGSGAAAQRLGMLFEVVGAAWPEPFAVSPPCCNRMSFDEALMVHMIDHAHRADRAGFFSLLTEMLPVEVADRLYNAARSLTDALPRGVFSPATPCSDRILD